ncbi:NADH-quinone oxidoreductase subunit L, partial [Escherichia coli]|nr:NADH-quinone oxidoreductase subunit L [Escherichia coli]
AGGTLIVGYWNAAGETLPATSGVLRGGEISQAVVLPALREKSDWSFSIEIDGTKHDVTEINGMTATTLADVIAQIQAKITPDVASVVFDGSRIAITNKSTGTNSVVGYPTVLDGGSFIGDLLAVAEGSGASLVNGSASTEISPETQLESLSKLKAQVNVKGAAFIDKILDAQLPLQTWLADAMAGPTPVSALIHAATMVTAGVYLIARTHGLFLMTPEVLHLVGIVGAVTLLLAGFAALVQTDIKRVLAYSTMSQIGYMFLALGVQAWDAAIFHLMTHAFFKALLFLASGSVILACHHEQNIFKMGGLRKSIPLVYLCFLVGGAALSALPLVTAGFFSKDEILAGAMANGHINLMVAGLVGAFMTSLYTFRMIFIVFHGKEQIHAHAVKGVTHSLPLIVLLILSTFVGALIVPPLQGVLPQTTELAHGSMLTLEITSGVVAVVGILLAAWLWLGKRTLVTSIANSAPGRLLSTWWYNAWGFDWLYDKVFVKPFLGIAWLLKRDPLNSMMNIPAVLSRFAGKGLLLSENGYLRWYVASMSIGAVVVLALLMVLR